ncbi:uncharacterized protein LOC132722259 isoform X4 [Ruditapes philippinarum]|uniref:uncharacterized protein LOC132722259 isoform X4 n=1 Tax=Ruditapes philippinarum TaxID=129788 RepID=UPI00295B1EBB|nr:uncharacterized protein LOC132722259 isoform X4 [Ruditapes philippinarum]
MPPKRRGRKRKARPSDEGECESRLLQPDPDIWILGDSIPYWAGVRANELGTPNLKLDGKSIGWWGIRGMSWDDFRRSVECNVILSKPPDVILIHLGGNDLLSKSLRKLRFIIGAEIKYLSEAFPDSVIIWIDILQRLSWNSDVSIHKIEESRKRINRWGRQQVRRHPKSEVISVDIDYKTPGFFRADGVHLSNIGLAFYIDAIKDVILKYI